MRVVLDSSVLIAAHISRAGVCAELLEDVLMDHELITRCFVEVPSAKLPDDLRNSCHCAGVTVNKVLGNIRGHDRRTAQSLCSPARAGNRKRYDLALSSPAREYEEEQRRLLYMCDLGGKAHSKGVKNGSESYPDFAG